MKRTSFLLTLILFLACCQKQNDNLNLRVGFSIDDSLLTVHETVKIKNLSDSNNVYYIWNFGDGFLSNERNPEHLYNDTGFFKINLVVKDNMNNSDSSSHIVRVGGRYVYEISLISLNERKYHSPDNPWDEDSTGVNSYPDVYFVIAKDNEPSLFESKTIFNVNQSKLPIIFQIPNIIISPALNIEIGIGNVGIYLYDKDFPESELMSSNKMSGASGNGFIYDKATHKGEFIVGFDSYYKIKYLIK